MTSECILSVKLWRIVQYWTQCLHFKLKRAKYEFYNFWNIYHYIAETAASIRNDTTKFLRGSYE